MKLGVIQAFRQSPVLDALTFAPTDSLKITFIRQKSLPAPAFRKIGESYSSSKGDVRPGEDRIYALGQNIDVDKTLVRMKNSITDGRALQRAMALEAMTRTFHYYLINGDPTTDEDGFTGLWYRTQHDLPSTQSISAGSLDISPDTSETAWYTLMIDKLEELIDACNDGDVDDLLMDRKTKLRLEAGFRRSNLLSTTKDQLGRKFTTYGEGGPRLVAMGNHRDETDESAGTKIIGHDETTGGGALTGSNYTSIYAVKYGKDHLGGANEYPLEVTDKKELDDGVTYRDVVDWPVGIYLPRPRSLARLHGLLVE
ncbi:MAG: hypothetical protein DRO01_03185 [Thermoproteota archaeon]|nr:MAG: hypothetical protein DRO01_03185 [Candidatus Korarchaeota archaeon]